MRNSTCRRDRSRERELRSVECASAEELKQCVATLEERREHDADEKRADDGDRTSVIISATPRRRLRRARGVECCGERNGEREVNCGARS